MERRRQQRVEALDGLQKALGLEALPVRIECFDISHIGGTHTVASMVVFEGGAPKKSDYRRFTIREVDPADDYACHGGGPFTPATRSGRSSPSAPPTTPSATRRFGALPNLIVIDGGKGQLAAGLGPLQGFRERGVAVVSLAKRIEEVFQPGDRAPIVLPHDTPELQLLQRVRDEAHRFAITHHRIRRDKAMTESIMDELPGVGPARKRALLQHFGSPEAVLGATREELEACPGCRRRSPATSTPTSTRRGRDERHTAPRASATPAVSRAPRRISSDLVVISGFSGAGKSSAMNVFEDAGYFCVDNLPAEMIRSLAELFLHEGSKVERAGVVSDSRGGEYFDGAARGASTSSTGRASCHRVLFLEADEQTLLTRYKETRRRHPLAPHGSVATASAPSASCSRRSASAPTS